LASEDQDKAAVALDKLDKATAAANATGARAELPFIEQVRDRASSLAAGTTGA
jgi:hypothetical protein